MAYGVDYSFYPHPSVSALKAAGVRFVGRYVSPDPGSDTSGKNLLPGEFKALTGAGLSIILYAESYAARMKEGAPAGKADAQHFAAVTKALGAPGAVMYCAADWDATPGDQPAINNYLTAVAGVLGINRTGIYGGFYPVKRALDAGKARYAVQTVAWSGGQWDPRAQVRQQLYVNVGGAQCDVLTSMKPDYGQWPRPPAPTPPPPGDYTADGTMTLADLAHQHGTDVHTLIWWMARHRPNGFGPQQAAYLDAGDWHTAMPAGMRAWFA